MAGFTPSVSPQSQNGFNRPRPLGDDLEKKAEVKPQNDTTQQQLKDTNSAWTSFLRAPDASPGGPQINITRLDTTPNVAVQTPTEVIVEEKPKLTFEEIFNNLARADAETVREQSSKSLEGSILFGVKAENSKEEKGEDQAEEAPSAVDQLSKPETKEPFSLKKFLLGHAEKSTEHTTKFAKRSWKEGKEVVGAMKDLWKNFIYLKEKKPDPKAKENAEKLAKRRANKARFISLLKEGVGLYYAAMRKMLMELEAKLGTNVLRTEDKNRLLGRNRNASFEGNDSIYAITQTAYAMMEERKRQQQAQSGGAASRGKPSRGQIFTDKNLQGERSGGNNMMSAVG